MNVSIKLKECHFFVDIPHTIVYLIEEPSRCLIHWASIQAVSEQK